MIKKLFRTLCIIFIPIVNNQQLYIVQEPWFPTISNVNFYLLKNNIDVHIPLIIIIKQLSQIYQNIRKVLMRLKSHQKIKTKEAVLISNITR